MPRAVHITIAAILLLIVGLLYRVGVLENANAQIGGWAHPARLNGLTNTVTPIIGRGGSLVMLLCSNSNNVVEFVQVFDAATNSAVTLNTTVPTLSFAVPATSSIAMLLSASGIGFGTGIQIAATNTATGAVAPGSALDCNAGYL